MWDFPDIEGPQNLVASVYEKGGVVDPVCHGPAGLLNVHFANGFRLVKGRRVAAFTNEDEIGAGKDLVVPFLMGDGFQEQGATHVSAENFTEYVMVDERLVTDQNPASAARMAKEMEKLRAEVIHQEKVEEHGEAAALRAENIAEKQPSKRPRSTSSTDAAGAPSLAAAPATGLAPGRF